MAGFDIAIKISLDIEHEGGYVNDKDDKGGETYKGISRHYHPNWSGWEIIDEYRNSNDFPRCLDNNPNLQELVLSFYKTEFWDKLMCDEINSQEIANKFFDMSLPIGLHSTVILIQRSICDMIQAERHIRPFVLSIDGKMGSCTLNAINGLNARELLDYFKLKCVDYFKEKHNDKFGDGWVRRAMS